MIIAFYPGAGGNRWFFWNQDSKKIFESNKSYDDNLPQSPYYRYIYHDTSLADTDLILTHTLNVPLLLEKFPAHKEIVVINGDLKSCLRRQWVLAGHRLNAHHFSNADESIRAIVGFHRNYYAQYPIDFTGATRIFDISTDNDDFCKMMRQELVMYTNQEFDEVFDMYNKIDHRLQVIENYKIDDVSRSEFLNSAEIMKFNLDRINNSLCLAKWKQSSLHLTTGHTNSCYHPPLHKIKIEDITRDVSGLHNTVYKKEQRKMMLEGTRPPECQYCWNMEDLGHLSDRYYRSAEPWAEYDFGRIVSQSWDTDICPSYVEVNFNNACNLRCSYCSPQFSSSWMDEVQRDGAYPTSVPHNDPAHFTGDRRPIPVREHNPYLEAFWAWWPTLYPNLKHFRMTGGEPLMDRNTYRVFDYVLTLPNPDLHLNVTSNFSVEPKLFDRYMDYVKRLCAANIEHFMQYVSLDSGIPGHAQYIRHGLQFRRLWDYVNRYLGEIPNRNSLTFIITMNNLSVLGLQKQLEWILDLRRAYSVTYQRVWFDTPVLRQPAWQSLQILPPAYAEILDRVADWMELNLETSADPFHGFKDYEVKRLRRDIAWMRSGHDRDWSKERADFWRFFAEHDRRRGTDFQATFPSMRQWWQECEYHAKNP